MKPLAGTFARNAVEHGVAGLNVDGGRLAAGTGKDRDGEASAERRYADRGGTSFAATPGPRGGAASGRYPSNLLLTHHPSCRRAGTRKVSANPAVRFGVEDGNVYGAGVNDKPKGRQYHGSEDGTEEVAAWECSPECPVAAMDRQAGERTAGVAGRRGEVGMFNPGGYDEPWGGYGDTGTASRFFFHAGFEPGEVPAFCLRYVAKASTAERGGTRHPTIKPLELVAYLAKLLLPPAREDAPRRLLVPFSGAGSEIIGALRVGWEEVEGIEQEPEWIADAERRIRDDAPLWNEVEVVERQSVPSPSDSAEATP